MGSFPPDSLIGILVSNLHGLGRQLFYLLIISAVNIHIKNSCHYGNSEYQISDIEEKVDKMVILDKDK